MKFRGPVTNSGPADMLPHERLHEELMPEKVVFLMLFAGFIIFGGVSYSNSWLPKPLKFSDAETHPGEFIAEFAYYQLKELSAIGPKPTGSYENEVLAAQFIHREIEYIIQRASIVNFIEVDIQKPTGSYYLDFKPYGFVNSYTEVQNIIVKISSADSMPSSVLINCHFDSVPLSPGSSDDGLNCAVMLEVLRVLSRSTQPLKHDVIFLFNGAEENPLQASHGFITQHIWAKTVNAFINLEACGSGGREILFQTGPNHPWLVTHYSSSVPHPHGMVVGEEIFQSGWIPSDTDFRIFRDFGNIPGLDFAHASNGYVYHTKYDNLNYIPLGTLQHTGDNVLALIKHIASSDELENPSKHAKGRAIYFDLFGFVMITYSETVGFLLNIGTIVMSMLTQWIILKTIRGLSHQGAMKLVFSGTLTLIYGWLLSLLSVVLTAVILGRFHCTMSWYSHPSLIFPLYWCPIIVTCFYCIVFLKTKRMDLFRPLEQAQILSACVQLVWCKLLLIGTLLGIRSSFILMLLVAFPTLSNILIILLGKQKSFCGWLSLYLVGCTVPLPFMLYHALLAYNLFIPITGRSGPSHNPESIVGLLSLLLCMLCLQLYVPLVVLLRKPTNVLRDFGGMYMFSMLVILLTPLGFPYSSDQVSPSPQRLIVHHTSRVFYNQHGRVNHNDSGFWVSHLDYNNPGSLKHLLAKAQSVQPFCETELYCGLPLFSPRMLQICDHTWWIPAPPPPVSVEPSLKISNETHLSAKVRQIEFTMSGPDRMGIFISPASDVNIIGWSFSSPVPSGEPKWKNRSTYFVNFVNGLPLTVFQFILELEKNSSWNKPILDIAVVGHYLKLQSKDLETFLQKYPDWVHITPITSKYSSWNF